MDMSGYLQMSLDISRQLDANGRWGGIYWAAMGQKTGGMAVAAGEWDGRGSGPAPGRCVRMPVGCNYWQTAGEAGCDGIARGEVAAVRFPGFDFALTAGQRSAASHAAARDSCA
jgi:hypothetical protein